MGSAQDIRAGQASLPDDCRSGMIAPGDPADRLLRWVEAAGVFLLGVVLMNYFYAASVMRPGAELGVPEHDSYYHVAMAQMLPEHGLLPKFPWLQFTYFRDQGDDFVSHHWGFHLLLLPFVKAAEWLTGDALPGGRWAMSAVFGANLLLFHLLLRQGRVPLHWLWIGLFLLLPDQFFVRHGFVRAIGASLIFMQLTLLALFAKRYLLAALTLAAYVHLYLGAVMYGPVLVATYAIAQVVGPKDDRRFPVRMVLLTAAGWAVGVVTYPYSAGMFEFLRIQVFGSGLSPDIEVGREWKPYTDPWFIVTMSAPLLAAWTGSLVLRLRMGPRLDARETTLLLVQFAFLLLTFKARRFIEYWPPFCLLSAAYLAGPPLRRVVESVLAWWATKRPAVRIAATAAGLIGAAAGCVLLWIWCFERPNVDAIVAEWRAWTLLAAMLALPVLIRVWQVPAEERGEAIPLGRMIAVIASGAALFITAWIAVASGFGSSLPEPRLKVPGLAWGVLVAAYGLVPLFGLAARAAVTRLRAAAAIPASAAVVLAALMIPAAVVGVGGKSFASAARQVRCYYNLEDIRELMAFLKGASRPGDVIFTDDWDMFPVFFYHNRHNYYIVGLDPKFTHQREPDLWSRYVKISRGEVPGTIRLASTDGGRKQATVGLTDIREHFRARFVVADRDHRRLADALARSPEVAEFVFPGDSYEKARHAPYVVFRIREPGEIAPLASRVVESEPGTLYLSHQRPVSATQGWGDLASDRTVDGNRIRLGGREMPYGLGTHAPAKLAYNIPDGFEWFEAVVGIDDETGGRGSAVVSIQLDGRDVYESPVLLGGAEPVVVRIPLAGARQIVLVADPTSDGQRYDHVCWGEARFAAEAKGALLLTNGSSAAASGRSDVK